MSKITTLNLTSTLVLVILLLACFVFSSFFSQLDLLFQDAITHLRLTKPNWFSIPQADRLTDEVVLVLLDEDSAFLLKERLSTEPQNIYSEVIDYISEGSPKVIALDIYLPATSDKTQNENFINALQNAPPTILKAMRRDDMRIVPPNPLFSKYAISAPSYFSTYKDEYFRTCSLLSQPEYVNQTIYSMQLEVIKHLFDLNENDIALSNNLLNLNLKDKKITIPLIDNEYMLLNYDIQTHFFKIVPLLDIYNEIVDPSFFKDKAVIIGAANSMSHDTLVTPVKIKESSRSAFKYDDSSRSEPIHSIYLTVLAIRNILKNSPIYPPLIYLTWLLIIVFAVLALMLFNYLKPAASVGVLLLSTVSLALISTYLRIYHNQIFDIAQSIFVISATFIFSVSHKYYFEIKEKSRIKHAFQHYVTASVVNEILKDPKKLNLHGEERTLSIFFSDIEGFTSISEKMNPFDVVTLLNEYLTAMTEIIFKYDGMLDKYEGDAIMAIFGAPISQTDHALRSLKCALENLESLSNLQNKWKSEGKPLLKIRIGINTGIAIVGNMGSKMRFNYTAIGDSVNLASRLEGANKLFQSQILASSYTVDAASEDILSRYLGKLKPAGKSIPVDVYEILADKSNLDANRLSVLVEMKTSFDKARAQYQDKNFEIAANLFDEHLKKWPHDKPALVLQNKCKGFMIVPPPPDWHDITYQEDSEKR